MPVPSEVMYTDYRIYWKRDWLVVVAYICLQGPTGRDHWIRSTRRQHNADSMKESKTCTAPLVLSSGSAQMMYILEVRGGRSHFARLSATLSQSRSFNILLLFRSLIFYWSVAERCWASLYSVLPQPLRTFVGPLPTRPVVLNQQAGHESLNSWRGEPE